MNKVIKWAVLSSCIVLLTACENEPEKQFELSVSTPIPPTLGLLEHLRKLPFENEFGATVEREDGKVVFTNDNNIFPYKGKGRWNNSEDSFYHFNDVYQSTGILFQDPEWGDLFATSALLYQYDALFLKDTYYGSPSIISNPRMVSDGLHNSIKAKLKETSLVDEREDGRTIVYWVEISSGMFFEVNHISLFHQQGQWVFQLGIPCTLDQKKLCLKKLQEINTRLELNNAMLANANEESLEPSIKPTSFYVDPYRRVFGSWRSSSGNRLSFKIANTDFEKSKECPNYTRSDRCYSYNNGDSITWFRVNVENTELREEEFFSQNHQGDVLQTKKSKYYAETQPVFIVEDTNAKKITGLATTYFNDNRLIQLEYGFHSNDLDARDVMTDIITNMRF